MTDGVLSVLVDSGVETGEIVVPDFFLVTNVMVKFDGVRASSVKSVQFVSTRLEESPFVVD